MKYNQDEKDKILAFLEQCIKLVESGDISEYNNITDTMELFFCVKRS